MCGAMELETCNNAVIWCNIKMWNFMIAKSFDAEGGFVAFFAWNSFHYLTDCNENYLYALPWNGSKFPDANYDGEPL